MGNRKLWLLCFLFLGLGFACGGVGLYLMTASTNPGLYLLIGSVVPIIVAAIFAVMAFRRGLKR